MEVPHVSWCRDVSDDHFVFYVIFVASCEISRTAGYFGKKLYSFAIFYLLNTKVLLIDEASPWRRDIDCN